MHVTTFVWVVTVGLASAFLLVDVFVIGRRPHEPSVRESGTILAGYVAAAVAVRRRGVVDVGRAVRR